MKYNPTVDSSSHIWAVCNVQAALWPELQVEGGIVAQPSPACPPSTGKTALHGWLQAPPAGSGGGMELESAYHFWGVCYLHSLGTGSLQVFPKARERQSDSSLDTSMKDGEKMGGRFLLTLPAPFGRAGRGAALRYVVITILLKTK